MITSERYNDYLSALLEGKKKKTSDIVKQLLDSDVPVKDVYLDLFHRSMYEVGSLWEQNKISVATEHLATAITEMLLTQVYPLIFAGEHNDRSILISCGVNELHQLGAKMVADYCEFLGWNTYFLGANTPIDSLIDLVKEKNPDIVGLSVSITSHLKGLEETLSQLKSESPETPIIVGGRAFGNAGAEILKDQEDVSLMNNIEELESYLSSLPCVTA